MSVQTKNYCVTKKYHMCITASNTWMRASPTVKKIIASQVVQLYFVNVYSCKIVTLTCNRKRVTRICMKCCACHKNITLYSSGRLHYIVCLWFWDWCVNFLSFYKWYWRINKKWKMFISCCMNTNILAIQTNWQQI